MSRPFRSLAANDVRTNYYPIAGSARPTQIGTGGAESLPLPAAVVQDTPATGLTASGDTRPTSEHGAGPSR
jgi:hypothetical protein